MPHLHVPQNSCACCLTVIISDGIVHMQCRRTVECKWCMDVAGLEDILDHARMHEHWPLPFLHVLQELFMPAAVAAEGPRPAPAPLSALCMTATRSVERIPDGSACERDNDQEAEPTTRAASAQEVASAQAQLFPALPAVNLRLQRISQDEAQEVVTELQHLSNEWCVMLRSDQLVISKHQCHHCTFPLPCLKSFVCQCPSRLTIRHVMVE